LKNRGNAGTRIVSVDIVTRLQAEWLRKRNLIASGCKKILFSPKCKDWLWDPLSLHWTMGMYPRISISRSVELATQLYQITKLKLSGTKSPFLMTLWKSQAQPCLFTLRT
jgi:hypothetical protein